jgi:hypothetical protein
MAKRKYFKKDKKEEEEEVVGPQCEGFSPSGTWVKK